LDTYFCLLDNHGPKLHWGRVIFKVAGVCCLLTNRSPLRRNGLRNLQAAVISCHQMQKPWLVQAKVSIHLDKPDLLLGFADIKRLSFRHA
jgi:hypothetical protein